jgi:hypothetical protein
LNFHAKHCNIAATHVQVVMGCATVHRPVAPVELKFQRRAAACESHILVSIGEVLVKHPVIVRVQLTTTQMSICSSNVRKSKNNYQAHVELPEFLFEVEGTIAQRNNVNKKSNSHQLVMIFIAASPPHLQQYELCKTFMRYSSGFQTRNEAPTM